MGNHPVTKFRFISPGILAIFGTVVLVIISTLQKKIMGAPLFSPTGFIIPIILGGLVGFCIGVLIRRIIAEQKQHIQTQVKSTAQLRKSEDMFHMLAENARDVLFRWNLSESRYEYISPAVHSITGYPTAKFMEDPELFGRILFAEDRKIITGLLSKKGHPKHFVEYRLQHKEGHTVWINQRSAYSRNESGVPVFLEGIATDITSIVEARKEKKLLSQQLNQLKKMESVGRLAGGIAHDFNNLLMVINGYADLVLDDLDPRDNKYSEVKQIHTAGLKAAGLTSQLLSFSRDQMKEPRVLDLTPVMQEFMAMLRRIIGKGITVDLEIEKDLPLVILDPVHFDQIILNLVINARDAMTNKGNLALALTSVEMDGQQCDEFGKEIFGSFVNLTVSDNGKGISPDVLERIFDPYFSTKQKGQGTGLGLANVVQLALQYHGHIQVETTLGEGTAFSILFPTSNAQIDPEIEIKSSLVTKDLIGSETILLVDDEGLVRGLTQTILEQYGYQVFVATDGEAGMEVFRQTGQSIDLLLTDIVMPGIDGRDLYQQSSALKPDLKVLFISGFSDSLDSDFVKSDKDLYFLAKPFSTRDLAVKVREVLDSPSRH